MFIAKTGRCENENCEEHSIPTFIKLNIGVFIDIQARDIYHVYGNIKRQMVSFLQECEVEVHSFKSEIY